MLWCSELAFSVWVCCKPQTYYFNTIIPELMRVWFRFAFCIVQNVYETLQNVCHKRRKRKRWVCCLKLKFIWRNSQFSIEIKRFPQHLHVLCSNQESIMYVIRSLDVTQTPYRLFTFQLIKSGKSAIYITMRFDNSYINYKLNVCTYMYLLQKSKKPWLNFYIVCKRV